MRTAIRNWEEPVLRIEITTQADSQGSLTHSAFSEHPEAWTNFIDKCRDALFAAAADIARSRGAGPQAIERRDERERQHRMGLEYDNG